MSRSQLQIESSSSINHKTPFGAFSKTSADRCLWFAFIKRHCTVRKPAAAFSQLSWMVRHVAFFAAALLCVAAHFTRAGSTNHRNGNEIFDPIGKIESNSGIFSQHSVPNEELPIQSKEKLIEELFNRKNILRIKELPESYPFSKIIRILKGRKVSGNQSKYTIADAKRSISDAILSDVITVDFGRTSYDPIVLSVNANFLRSHLHGRKSCLKQKSSFGTSNGGGVIYTEKTLFVPVENANVPVPQSKIDAEQTAIEKLPAQNSSQNENLQKKAPMPVVDEQQEERKSCSPQKQKQQNIYKVESESIIPENPVSAHSPKRMTESPRTSLPKTVEFFNVSPIKNNCAVNFSAQDQKDLQKQIQLVEIPFQQLSDTTITMQKPNPNPTHVEVTRPITPIITRHLEANEEENDKNNSEENEKNNNEENGKNNSEENDKNNSEDSVEYLMNYRCSCPNNCNIFQIPQHSSSFQLEGDSQKSVSGKNVDNDDGDSYNVQNHHSNTEVLDVEDVNREKEQDLEDKEKKDQDLSDGFEII